MGGQAINDLMESQFLALLRMSNLTAALEESLDLLRQPATDAKAKRGSANGGNAACLLLADAQALLWHCRL